MVAFVDVAKLAGVSTATVSRVLSGHPSVKEETRLRVEAACKTLNYRVSTAARSLRTAESRLVLAMVPDFSRPFYSDVLQGITHTAHENDYEVLVCETLELSAHERAFDRMLGTRMHDGAISMSPLDTQRIGSDEMRDMPAVACLETETNSRLPRVCINDRQAAKDAVLYLLSKGHRRIAMINGDADHLYAQLRRSGYLDALREAGLDERPAYVQNANGYDVALGELAARRLLAIDERPTAIFAASDLLAIGAIKAALSSGLEVPRDLAVVGFDDTPIAEIFEPALTTIAQPRRRIGEEAMRLLLHRIKGEMPESVTLPHALSVRRSA